MANGILSPTLKTIPEKYYPLPLHPLPILPYPEIPSCSSPLSCTEPESSDQTESHSLGAPADGLEEERLELALRPDDVTGKHRDREKIPVE